MNEAIYTFRSYSSAAKAYDLLTSNRIPAYIHRTTNGSSSCGYSIKVPGSQTVNARDLMDRNRIYYKNMIVR